mmetsp:Transcript_25570/g.59528  ORF Transcript_25570/g.59528 Transcript_25570/m.59528 type:complete len:210 (-) Transcript_25570:552-1181(-)
MERAPIFACARAAERGDQSAFTMFADLPQIEKQQPTKAAVCGGGCLLGCHRIERRRAHNNTVAIWQCKDLGRPCNTLKSALLPQATTISVPAMYVAIFCANKNQFLGLLTQAQCRCARPCASLTAPHHRSVDHLFFGHVKQAHIGVHRCCRNPAKFASTTHPYDRIHVKLRLRSFGLGRHTPNVEEALLITGSQHRVVQTRRTHTVDSA